ncbi:MAG: CoB--CoM heterodisulfide reductase iron-sulfur subunit B family protein [Spirochaetota bacterium]
MISKSKLKYAYYPGCSAESTARDQHSSAMAVAQALGVEMTEIKGWTCCGSTPGHQTDRILAASLAAANLAKARDLGLDMIVNCAACYSRMKSANFEIANDIEIRRKVEDAIGKNYDGSVKVKHFIEVLLNDIGIDAIKNTVTNPIAGLKVAPYYGCLLVRPPDVTKFDNPENPVFMDRLVKAMGGESIDWPHKVECCGAGLTLTRVDVVLKLTESILRMAKESGADCIIVACPMCQMNLDMRQLDIAKETGKKYNMPVLYISQLLGLSFGINEKELGLNKLMISPSAVLNITKGER